MKADIDYATSEAETTYGIIGVKVWVYKGDNLGSGAVVQAPAAETEEDKKPRRAPRAPRKAEGSDKPEVKPAVKRVRKVVKPAADAKAGE